MMDYKKMVEYTRDMAGYVKRELYEMGVEETLLSCADAIETLLAERDAAVESLFGRCDQCTHIYECIEDEQKRTLCAIKNRSSWEWCGPQKEE